MPNASRSTEKIRFGPFVFYPESGVVVAGERKKVVYKYARRVLELLGKERGPLSYVFLYKELYGTAPKSDADCRKKLANTVRVLRAGLDKLSRHGGDCIMTYDNMGYGLRR